MLKRNIWKSIAILLVVKLSAISICSAQSNNRYKNNPLYIAPETQNFSNNPALLERIKKTPHGYFRFINILFSQEVCERFADKLAGTPSYNLHGDAHLEQYAVTDLGRGLTDFDDSSTGPAVIDIMRFGVSMHLACRENGWEDHVEQVFNKFLLGYRGALIDPEVEVPEPKLVKKIKAKFKFDRKGYFEWAESIVEPMTDNGRKQIINAMKPYIETMRFMRPHLTSDFFKIKSAGHLKMGIGSAQDIKYLMRIEGETNDPLDDVLLEVKEVRDLSAIKCINITQKTNPFRILIGQSRIAYEPYKFLGYIKFNGITFWVHSWVDNYKEINIGKSFQSVEDLYEVAYDIGAQLGRGHTNQIASPLDIQLRREQINFLSIYEDDIKKVCLDLANETVDAWEKFCSHTKK